MLNIATTKIKKYTDRVKFILGDIRDISYKDSYRLVISSFVVHHLDDKDKVVLTEKIFRSLCNCGVFLNVDQIEPEDADVKKMYRIKCFDQMKAKGFDSKDPDYEVKPTTFENQLKWLKKSGFVKVHMPYMLYNAGIFCGYKIL